MTNQIKLIVVVIFSLFLQNCKYPDNTYIIKNESNYNMEITLFDKSKVLEKITIKSNDFFLKVKPSGGGNNKTPFQQDSDSLVIVFNNSRAIINYCNGTEFASCPTTLEPFMTKKNLMNFPWSSGSTTKSTGKGKTEYTIIFDNNDFENAKIL